MKTEIIRNPSNLNTSINCSMIINYLDNVNEGDIINLVVESIVKEISKEVLTTHSSEIISKINFDIVSNLASIELGKRASKLVDNK